ncbi:hypothetical protein PR202_ga22228 [Eleusine coracana subsp. coracana]|uniref:Uncharacterized protein n=1 Tax=Eleusine coracana subsp. coracana TaxID=191504 RepID=A0AAV5D138_ELECO|nr:hypothetical protein PR202_ga22228 [Eleusine coracana subsp. coracana]
MESAGGKCGAGPRAHGHHHQQPVLPAGRLREALSFAAGALAAALVLLGSASVLTPPPVPNIVALPSTSSASSSASSSVPEQVNVADGPRTFYDDPSLSYSVRGGKKRLMTDWDAKRAAWLRTRGLDPSSASVTTRVVMVSGSQPEPCRAPGGDHLLLRFLKNKQDYCRLHDIPLLYNTAHLEASMVAYWAKIPAVRAAMLAHPEAEWGVVGGRGRGAHRHGLLPPAREVLPGGAQAQPGGVRVGEGGVRGEVVGGAQRGRVPHPELPVEPGPDGRVGAAMGPASPEYDKWGRTVQAELSGGSPTPSPTTSPRSCTSWRHAPSGGATPRSSRPGYYFQGYWAEIVGRLDGVAKRYDAVKREGRHLRRRHAEREHLAYAAMRNEAVRWKGGKSRGGVMGPDGGGQEGWRRPFVTHFTGCNPCGGERNPAYSAKSCRDGVRRALAFADDQVLRAYGFRHAAPLSDSVTPLPFGYPS